MHQTTRQMTQLSTKIKRKTGPHFAFSLSNGVRFPMNHQRQQPERRHQQLTNHHHGATANHPHSPEPKRSPITTTPPVDGKFQQATYRSSASGQPQATIDPP
ncbi:unnamed protein product [Lactuca virosa]|uniref:Uncharacterized protein n=1 Tax=Lactuca virosa TaxID=75947 RepID=A0AAU9NAD3_9ASTR|nr:unnamed protein product [Lactuca virosa]